MLLPPFAVLQVGTGLAFARIEDAVAASHPGDVVEVSPGVYPKTAVHLTVPNLTLRGIGRAVLDGQGFDYSGVGVVPRAVVQIEADGCTVRGFEILGAHNATHNGAAIRIVAAHAATITDCDLHGNDMGVMSNGVAGDPHAAEGQLFERCHIHHNGDPGEPGQNHNLYLGGTGATLRFCEIDHALTGHDLKSRTTCFVSSTAGCTTPPTVSSTSWTVGIPNARVPTRCSSDASSRRGGESGRRQRRRSSAQDRKRSAYLSRIGRFVRFLEDNAPNRSATAQSEDPARGNNLGRKSSR